MGAASLRRLRHIWTWWPHLLAARLLLRGLDVLLVVDLVDEADEEEAECCICLEPRSAVPSIQPRCRNQPQCSILTCDACAEKTGVGLCPVCDRSRFSVLPSLSLANAHAYSPGRVLRTARIDAQPEVLRWFFEIQVARLKFLAF